MNCPTCRNLIASNAYNCPNCGHKVRSTPTNIFFKIVLALLILGIVVFIGLIEYYGREIAMLSDVYYTLKSEEKLVPNIVGKNFSESEKELALLGLKIKKRADRVSSEAPNTVIEQLPKPGETIKTGQMIIVVTSKGDDENGDKSLKKSGDEDDTEKIEEMIDDKSKVTKSNSNARKKANTMRESPIDNRD